MKRKLRFNVGSSCFSSTKTLTWKIYLYTLSIAQIAHQHLDLKHCMKWHRFLIFLITFTYKHCLFSLFHIHIYVTHFVKNIPPETCYVTKQFVHHTSYLRVMKNPAVSFNTALGWGPVSAVKNIQTYISFRFHVSAIKFGKALYFFLFCWCLHNDQPTNYTLTNHCSSTTS